MTTVDLPVALPWITFGLTWFAIGLLVLGIHRLLRQPLARLEPGQRSQILFALAMLPLVVAALVVVLEFSPHIGGLIVDHHCHPATGCANHVPIFKTDLTIAAVWTVLIVVVTVAAGWLIISMLMRSVSIGRVLESMAGSRHREVKESSEPAAQGGTGFHVVENSGIFAYCTGLFRTRVLVSRGLIDRLSARELEAVLAHEHAHVHRRDNLRRLLVTFSLWPLPRRWRRGMIRDLEAATEAACDRVAVEVLGNTDAVANAIRAVAQQPQLNGPFRRLSMAVMADHSSAALEARISELYSEVRAGFASFCGIGSIVAAYGCIAIVATRLAHHVAEFFIY